MKAQQVGKKRSGQYRLALWGTVFVCIVGACGKKSVSTRVLNSTTTSTNQQYDMWRSSTSTLQQKVVAASNLVPIGTSSDEACAILGPGATRDRYFGPFIDTTSGKSGGFNETMLRYAFPGGWVTLELDDISNRVQRISVMWPAPNTTTYVRTNVIKPR
jgi:hypothetical protein